MKLFFTRNNYLTWGFLFCWGLFLILLHLGFKELCTSAVERQRALLAAAVHPTQPLGIFPPDTICFMKVPAEINTSLTNSTSSLRKHFYYYFLRSLTY